jgi:hypothetical protein
MSHETFPEHLKMDEHKMLYNKNNIYNEVLKVYYNEYKNTSHFSFDHLCYIINKITGASVNKVLDDYHISKKWNLRRLEKRYIEYVIQYLIEHGMQ